MSNNRPWLKLIVLAVLCTGWFFLMDRGITVGGSDTPPLGSFFNPFEGFYRNNSSDYWNKNLDLPGLRAPVDVYYDERLVPHIYATSDRDLYYTQGYIQAQHRLFQFDIVSRAAEGTLSELLGELTVDIDRERRRIGGGELAAKIDTLWQSNPSAFQAVLSYADGVNAYIDQLSPKDYPIEYKLLNAAPSKWSPRRTALVAVNMAYTLNYANSDVQSTNTRNLLGERSFEFLFPDRDPNEVSVIPPNSPFQSRDTALINASEKAKLGLSELLGSRSSSPKGLEGYKETPEGIGSNNWAIAGPFTSTGKPLLANDPHLGLTLPSIWFESELHAGGLAVHGVSLPGVPGITIGFNEASAWGVTNVGFDVLDWHEIEYTNPSNTRYRTANGRTAEVDYRIEKIKVRGKETISDTVVVTEFGPIVYTDPEDYRYGLAMDWLTLKRPSAEILETFLELNKSKDIRDFLGASYKMAWPAQNIIYANKKGSIALRVSGTIPRNLPDEGKFIKKVGEPEVIGYLDPTENPFAVNPRQSFLASTNQISTDDTYPYDYRGTFEHYRSRRINALIRGQRKSSIETMKQFQMDSYSVFAADLVPILLKDVKRDDLSLTARGQLDLLQEWNFRFEHDALAPVVFEEWAKALRALAWDEFEMTRQTGRLETPEDWRMVQLLKNDPLSPWFDIKKTDKRESASDIITAALITASEEVQDLVNDKEDYAWADYNNAGVQHYMRLPAFSRSNLPVSGRKGTLNAQNGNIGPSWRMVVDLSNKVGAEVVYPGGQSGHPGNPHYDDMVSDWVEGRYHHVELQASETIKDNKQFTHLTFTP